MNAHTAHHAPRRRPPCPCLLAVALGLVASTPAFADAVTDWNVTAGSIAPRFGGPQQQARAMAIVQIAVHDALNAIDRRYETYTVVGTASVDASPDAAVAAAAHKALRGLLDPLPPSQAKTDAINVVETTYAAALSSIPDGTAENQGVTAGEAAADAILALRGNDGSATPHAPYTLAAAPGVYRPTPNPEFPSEIVPAFGLWGQVLPFAVRSALQFRPEPGEIFDLSSDAYAREYNEVQQIGDARLRGASADSEESDIARFWPGGGSNWNLTARLIVSGTNLDPWQHARLFALLNIAEADGLITTMGAKYAYNFWRPVTAIRWVDDGNPHTASDATWRPFLVTPPYPDYPCALPTATGASAEVLRRYFGTDDLAFTRSFDAGPVPLPAPLVALPGKTITRHFDSLSQAADEAASARIYAGIHFRSGCTAGVRVGTQVGRFVFLHYLRPMK